MKRGEILDSVKHTITQDRNNRHGEPENSFPLIADRWNEYLENMIEDNNLKPSDVAEMMAIFKDCRFQVQPENPDNKHDQIGYLAIAAELRENEQSVKVVGTEGPEVHLKTSKKGWDYSYNERSIRKDEPLRKPQSFGEIITKTFLNGDIRKYQAIRIDGKDLIWQRFD